jgi:hypothetical protein
VFSVLPLAGARLDHGPAAVTARPAVRVVYGLPAGARGFADTPAAIRHEVGEISRWFASQADGGGPRMAPLPDGSVPVVRLSMSRTDVVRAGEGAFRPVVAELRAALSAGPDDVVLAYVDAGAAPHCGQGDHETRAAVLWLAACGIFPATTSTFPGGATYLAAHELAHALGAAPACAPHATKGHVNDDRADLLYDGPAQRDWDRLALDVHHDDYYATANPACPPISADPVWDDGRR